MINIQNKVIQPVQNLFEQNVLQPYLEWMAEGDANFKNISLEFSNSTPVSFLGDIDVKQVLTLDEQRAIAGFMPATEEQKIEINGRMTAAKTSTNA